MSDLPTLEKWNTWHKSQYQIAINMGLKNLRSITLNKIDLDPMQIPLYGHYLEVVKAIAKETSFGC